MAKADLTVSRLKEMLSYNPCTGLFTRKVPVNGRYGRVGSVCGSPDRKGHLHIGLDGQKHSAHRLAWFYVHESWPLYQIDHISGIKADNRIENLRDVTGQVNQQNRLSSSGNNSGFLGVTPNAGNTFKALIWIDGRTKYIGTYKTAELAHQAYLEVKRVAHQGCTI